MACISCEKKESVTFQALVFYSKSNQYFNLYLISSPPFLSFLLGASFFPLYFKLEQTKKHPYQLSVICYLWFVICDFKLRMGFVQAKNWCKSYFFALEPLMTSPIQSIYLFLSHCRSVHLLITACVNRSVNLSLCSQLFFFQMQQEGGVTIINDELVMPALSVNKESL